MVKEIDHIQLLRTKLHQPPIPVDHVRRVGILARLKKEANRSAILISAPAGYGKSTLVASWLAECGCCWSYVSLDEGDNTPSRLLGCIVAAVRTAVPDSIPDTLALLEAPNLPPTAIVATTLLNEVEKLGQNLLIALDDVHCLKDPAALEILDLLLRQPSPYLRFILIGRRDPALPIASLRASGMLTEIRMRDLRFSAEETTEFLRATTGQPADALAAANLVEKTEGWVTGLRLAGLAVAGRDDIKSRFLELKGTSSYILDFLVAEVLDRQPPEVRDLLLATSVLGRFCAPLCDALREQSGGEAPERLDGLEFITWLRSNNLFIIPLDTENRWFRYHHLFQDLLKHQLARKISPEEIAELHLRAFAWCEQEGLIEEAIQLALSAGDPETAADIVERHCEAHYDQNRWYVVDRWLESLPTEIKQQRPHLLLTEARLLNDRFRLAEIPAVVEQARALLEARPGAVLDHAELNYFHGFLQYWGGDGPTSLACLEKALEALPEDHHGYVRAQVELFVGLATQFCGRPEEAIGRLKGWIKDRSLRSGLLWERLQFGLITIHLVDGNLPAAHREGRVFLDDGRRTGQAFIASWANYLLGTVAFHEFDIEGVRSHFCEVAEHRYSANTRAAVDSMAGLAIAAELAGRPEQAEPWLVQARELAGWANDSSLDIVIQATEARIALLRGDLETAARWQRSFDMPVDAPSMIFFLVNPCITECRVLTALGTESSLRAAEHKLAEVRTAVEKVHNRLQVVDVMALQALTATQQGRRSLALDLLQETLELAVPRGWLRPFVELGQPLANLLQDLKASDRAVDLVDSILAAIPGTAHRTAAASQLIEPLSHRELDVLELLAKRMQNKEIGEKLSISPDTVKSHLRTIYQKLDVTNRREAAQKATRLRLVE